MQLRGAHRWPLRTAPLPGAARWRLVALSSLLFLGLSLLLPVAAQASPGAVVSSPRGLNLRAEPWGEVLAVLPPGTGLHVIDSTVDDRGLTWLQVEARGLAGWVYAGGVRTFAEPVPAEALPGRVLDVRLEPDSRATIVALEDGEVVRVIPAWAGPPGMRTPTGEFRIQARLGRVRTTIWSEISGHEWDLPYFLQFSGDYGIHGPMVHPVTRAVYSGPTAGCLAPSLEDAGWLYDWALPGTLLRIYWP